MPKKALVVGGAGFIGSNLVGRLCKEGYDVTVLDNLDTGLADNLANYPDVKLVVGDIRHAGVVRELAEGVDVVFHLAASVGCALSIERPLHDSLVNVLGTLNVLEAVRTCGVRKLVFSSSAAIYGALQRLPIDELHPCEPDSPYGCSKLCAEKLCLNYARLYGIDAVCLRYFNVYGPGQRYDNYGNVIPIFARQLLSGNPLTIYGDGNQTRDFVSVHDVVEANLLAAATPGASGAYNIGSGAGTSVNALVDLMYGSGERPTVINTPLRPGDVRDSVADISKAAKKLRYSPNTILEQGLEEYMTWARKLYDAQ